MISGNFSHRRSAQIIADQLARYDFILVFNGALNTSETVVEIIVVRVSRP